MVGTVLLVVSQGFDDMAFLANQVIIEEAGNDVISVSKEGGAIKGGSSSVMTVSIDEAQSQNIDYSAIILVGGEGLDDISILPEMLTSFHSAAKIIGAIGTGVNYLSNLNLIDELSSDGSIVLSDNCLSMANPSDSEAFAEKMSSLI